MKGGYAWLTLYTVQYGTDWIDVFVNLVYLILYSATCITQQGGSRFDMDTVCGSITPSSDILTMFSKHRIISKLSSCQIVQLIVMIRQTPSILSLSIFVMGVIDYHRAG